MPKIAAATLGALLPMLAGGCAGRYPGPRTLAALGTMAVVAGSASWATGEGLDPATRPGASRALINGGFTSVAVGLAAIVVAGGWMAVTVTCTADPDCNEDEQCREIPAPPGGIPYKQCMPRS
jgi:hypothetical protein